MAYPEQVIGIQPEDICIGIFDSPLFKNDGQFGFVDQTKRN